MNTVSLKLFKWTVCLRYIYPCISVIWLVSMLTSCLRMRCVSVFSDLHSSRTSSPPGLRSKTFSTIYTPHLSLSQSQFNWISPFINSFIFSNWIQSPSWEHQWRGWNTPWMGREAIIVLDSVQFNFISNKFNSFNLNNIYLLSTQRQFTALFSSTSFISIQFHSVQVHCNSI